MLHINCQNCGQPNPDIARVCRYCGHALRPDTDARRTDYAEPRAGAYVPTHDWASSAPLPATAPYAQPQPIVSAENFRCPFCQTTAQPILARRISTGGWIVFAALIVAC
ncbi:MAG: hypothetical protein QOF61_2645, partial [Acidobacteriota bacterium]|nr:hypothetical protein [Acidobacteriota bacterium]